MLRTFGLSGATTLVALVSAAAYGLHLGGLSGALKMLFLCAVVGVLEVSMSFDNAVVNAIVLKRMSAIWQRRFLTWGVPIATFGMRFTLPLAVVAIAAQINPFSALRRAFNPPANHAAFFPDGTPSYATLLHLAEPLILGFGCMFLLPLALKWATEDREVTWLTWIERPLIKAGRLDSLFAALSVLIFAAVTSILVNAHRISHDQLGTVLIAGMIGLAGFLVASGLDNFFNVEEEEIQTGASDIGTIARAGAGVATGGLATFLYLEMLDASFSFDGVIGSFAITSDPIIIALGTGLIGSMFVRSLTVKFVRDGTLEQYPYLEHGAHWAIGVLAILMMVEIGIRVDDYVTALVSMGIIGAAFLTSVVRNRHDAKIDSELKELIGGEATC